MFYAVWLAIISVFFSVGDGFLMSARRHPIGVALSRRDVIRKGLVSAASFTGALVVRPRGGYTAAQKVNKALGQESFRKIREARALLDQIDSPLRAREFDEIQELLQQEPSANLDKALVNLVQSNVLPSEDKVAVGTIRRYGLAADALIMLGALSAAARDGDGGEARRYLALSKESLNDILTIAVNNDLNKAQ